MYRTGQHNHAALREKLKTMALNKDFSHIAVCGDFNYPNIRWSTGTSSVGEDMPDSLFIECTRDAFLSQHVEQPTRARGLDTPNLLDLVLTNEPGIWSQRCST